MATRTLPTHPNVTHREEDGYTLAVFTFPAREAGAWAQAINAEEYFCTPDGGLVRRCGRCTVHGKRPEHPHIENGVCFSCDGSAIKPTMAGSYAEMAAAYRRRQVRRIADAKRQATKAQKKEDNRKAFVEANPEFAQALARWRARIADMAQAEIDAGEEEYGIEGWMMQRHTPQLEELHTRLVRYGSLTPGEVSWFLDEFAQWEKRRSEAEQSRYAGQVGEQATVTGTVVYMALTEGRYGNSWLVILKGTGDDAGVTLKFYSTARWVRNLETGDQVTVTGTVKKHTTNKHDDRVTVARSPRTPK